MTLASAVAQWHRARLYKVIACLVLCLIALQYLSGILDRRSIETIFTINATRYADHSYKTHPRGLIIYGPATVSNLFTNNNASNVASTTIPPMMRSSSTKAPKYEVVPTRSSIGIVPSQELLSSVNTTADNTVLPLCPLLPPNLLGPVTVNMTAPDMSIMEGMFPELKPGGRGWPSDCTARHRVAIIIPFRDRLSHLHILLYNLHPILLRQQIDYQIFVIEQEGDGLFNRAMLMNIGYVEALKEKTFDCFIFHDVDLLPEDDRNLYTCPEQPRHMSVAVDKFKYRLPYNDLFGGVSAMSRDHFKLVNGFSNVYWGWGGEDDDMANRIKAHNLHISRYPPNIARYKMLTHAKEKPNPQRYEILRTGKRRFSTDGLRNLQYEVVRKKKLELYTWILVKISQPS